MGFEQRLGVLVLAITAAGVDGDDPLSGLRIGDHPGPILADGWAVVEVKAASLNHHDLWTLRGVGIDPKRLPIVIGCDAAGVAPDGREVIVHSVIAPPGTPADGSELLSPEFSMLSERHDGTFAELVAVPEINLIEKPAELSFEEAACLPTAYLTAYRALFTKGQLTEGDTVLIQGAGGGFATACLLLAKAAGVEALVTSRSAERREQALSLGADAVFEPGARLPKRVDAVMESVGEATWTHSMKCLKPGGRIVVVGATSGPLPQINLQLLFYRQLSALGSTMGTREELEGLTKMLVDTGARPLIDSTMPLAGGRVAFERMGKGDLFGKLVLTLD